jgi:hypothetical protein
MDLNLNGKRADDLVVELARKTSRSWSSRLPTSSSRSPTAPWRPLRCLSLPRSCWTPCTGPPTHRQFCKVAHESPDTLRLSVELRCSAAAVQSTGTRAIVANVPAIAHKRATRRRENYATGLNRSGSSLAGELTPASSSSPKARPVRDRRLTGVVIAANALLSANRVRRAPFLSHSR